MSALSLRPIRPTEVANLARYTLPKFHGVTAIEDGEVIGHGVVIWIEARPFLCLEITEKLRQKPIFMNKIARSIINATVQVAGEIYTVEDEDEPTASRWLQWLGFVPTGEMREGRRVLKWQNF